MERRILAVLVLLGIAAALPGAAAVHSSGYFTGANNSTGAANDTHVNDTSADQDQTGIFASILSIFDGFLEFLFPGNDTVDDNRTDNATDWNVTDDNLTDNVTDDNMTDWNVTDGNITDGNVTDGNLTDGNVTDENMTGGNTTEGNTTDDGLTVEVRPKFTGCSSVVTYGSANTTWFGIVVDEGNLTAYNRTGEEAVEAFGPDHPGFGSGEEGVVGFKYDFENIVGVMNPDYANPNYDAEQETCGNTTAISEGLAFNWTDVSNSSG